MKILFLICLIFSTKGYMLLLIPLGGFLFYRDKKWLIENIKWGILGKVFCGIILPYGNITAEGIRLLYLLFFYEIYKNRSIEFLKNNKNRSIGYGLLGILIIGSFWNLMSPGGSKSAKDFFEQSKYIILPFVLYNNLKNTKEKIILQYLLSFSIVIETLRIIWMNYKVSGLNLFTSYFREGAGYITSLFSVLIPLVFIFFINSKEKRDKVYYILCLIIGFLPIYITKTRGLFLGLGLIIGFIIILRYKYKGIIYLGLICIALGFGLRENNFFRNRLSNLNDPSNRGRVYLYRAGIYTFKNNYIRGSGTGNTQKYFIEYSKIDYEKERDLIKNQWEYDFYKYQLENFPDTHNNILDLIAENGILGIFMIAIMYILIPIEYIRRAIEKKNMEYIYYLIPIISYELIGMTWSTWTRHRAGVPYFCIVFFFYFYLNRKKERNQ